jgi:hypothetical protein
MNLRPYQKAAITGLPVSIIGGLKDIATLLQTEPREATVDAIEARPAAAMRITKIDADALDHLLAPYIRFGMLNTAYHAATGATVYGSALGHVIALSIGSNHFANADGSYDSAPEWAEHKWLTGPASHGASDIGTLAYLVANTPTPVRATDTKAWDDVPPVPVSLPAPGKPSPALYIQQCGRGKRTPQPVQWALENPMTGEVVERGEFRDGKMFSSAKDWAESMLNRDEPK